MAVRIHVLFLIVATAAGCGDDGGSGDDASPLEGEPTPLESNVTLRWDTTSVTATHGMAVAPGGAYPEGWIRFVFADSPIGCDTDLIQTYNNGPSGALFSYFVLESPMPAADIATNIEVLSRGQGEEVAQGMVSIDSFGTDETSGSVTLDEADFGISGDFRLVRCP